MSKVATNMWDAMKTAELQKNNGWHVIESEADLPKENGVYLTTISNGVKSEVHIKRFDNQMLQVWEFDLESNWRVIAWRELPEPYKAEAVYQALKSQEND